MNTAANVVNCIRRMLGSIRVRLLLFVVVALAVSLMLAGLNIHVVAGGIMERMRENTIQAEISQICDNLVSQLDSVSIQMNTLQNNSDLSALMSNVVFSMLDEVQIRISFRKTVMTLFTSFPQFKSVGLYSVQDECLMVFSSKSVQDYCGSDAVGWIRDLYKDQRLGEMCFFGGEEVQYGSPLMKHFVGSGQIICTCLKIPSGMLLLAYEEQMLADQYDALAQMNGHSVYIFNREGTILSSSDKAAIRSAYLTPETENLRVYRRTLEHSNLEFACHVPSDTGYAAELESLGSMTVFSLIMAFLATAGGFLLCLNRMMRPISGMAASIAHVERGDYSVHVNAPGSDELSKLARQYNGMLISLQELTDENIRVEQQRRNSELQALRNQINPHFLYNTLNAIKWMAMMEGSKKVADSLAALGGLLSPLLKASNPLCALREEIELSRKYMALMNMRYMAETPMEVHIPEELMDAAVPRLCLQPILENAILHGFAAEKKWGRITICAWESEGYLQIDVLDDGMGMADDAIQRLNARLESGEQSDRIGVINTNMRIRLHYGEDCGLRIMANPDGGLCVRFKMRHLSIG